MSKAEHNKETGREEFSLVLRDGDKVIFSSRKRGLRPLLECVAACAGKLRGGFLIDRVTGLAASRLITASRMINRLEAGVISEGAVRHLRDHSIQVVWKQRTDIIRKSGGAGVCPMEELSQRLPDDGDFFPAVFRHFSMNIPISLLKIPENKKNALHPFYG
ncbi:MAG: DUF1893 domain-containing protein [PVC group bacterium]